jgi:hypothetical protein
MVTSNSTASAAWAEKFNEAIRARESADFLIMESPES